MSAKGSHKHAGGSGKYKASASSSNHQLSQDLGSFLFVINELIVHDDDRFHEGDGWHNREPPSEPRFFQGEIPGTVMKYQNGQVTEAREYKWHRGDFNTDSQAWPEGSIHKFDLDDVPMFTEEWDYHYAINPPDPTEYKQLAVFSCNPFLPIAILRGDPLSEGSLDRVPLLFHHPENQPGVSHAVHRDSPAGPGGGMCKFVAGASPSWMPSLVPKTYRHPHRPYTPPPSRGLSGELPIILGLMAFSEAPSPGEEAARRIFLEERRWRNGEWHHSAAPKGYARSSRENPRGFLVTVYLDPEKEANSNKQCLEEMQWSRLIVRDSRR